MTLGAFVELLAAQAALEWGTRGDPVRWHIEYAARPEYGWDVSLRYRRDLRVGKYLWTAGQVTRMPLEAALEDVRHAFHVLSETEAA